MKKIVILGIVLIGLFILGGYFYLNQKDFTCMETLPPKIIISDEVVTHNITTKCTCGIFADCPIK
jgi:hypothetical protein